MNTEMKELIRSSQKQIKECYRRIDEIHNGAFPEDFNEIAILEKRIEFLEKPIPNL